MCMAQALLIVGFNQTFRFGTTAGLLMAYVMLMFYFPDSPPSQLCLPSLLAGIYEELINFLMILWYIHTPLFFRLSQVNWGRCMKWLTKGRKPSSACPARKYAVPLHYYGLQMFWMQWHSLFSSSSDLKSISSSTWICMPRFSPRSATSVPPVR